jgi:hypothetical protein
VLVTWVIRAEEMNIGCGVVIMKIDEGRHTMRMSYRLYAALY